MTNAAASDLDQFTQDLLHLHQADLSLAICRLILVEDFPLEGLLMLC